jgi:predicted nucleic acid-binding protein
MIEFNKVFVDTAPFIYFIEKDMNNPEYYEKVRDFFRQGYDNDKQFVTSVITAEEYFVFPYRNNEVTLIDTFRRLVKTMDIDVKDINEEIADKAAQIRAEYRGFKAMDALQLAVACLSKCDLFLTNDKQLKRFKEIKCITVGEIE